MALSSCHMTMTCKINKPEKPGGPLGIFHALFGRCAAFYGHFRVDAVTSEWSTCISSSGGVPSRFLKSIFIQKRQRLISLLWSVIMVEYSFLN